MPDSGASLTQAELDRLRKRFSLLIVVLRFYDDPVGLLSLGLPVLIIAGIMVPVLRWRAAGLDGLKVGMPTVLIDGEYAPSLVAESSGPTLGGVLAAANQAPASGKLGRARALKIDPRTLGIEPSWVIVEWL